MSDLFKVSQSMEKLKLHIVDVKHPSLVKDEPSSNICFPLVNKLSAHFIENDPEDVYLSCIDIYKELENNASDRYLCARVEKGFKPTFKFIPNRIWNMQDSKWDTIHQPVLKAEIMIKINTLGSFIDFAQNRTRKTLDHKLRLFKKFNIDKDAASVKVPIEVHMLDVLQQCIPFAMEFQYKLGKYYLDCFIPRLRLCVEIDEHGHSSYDSNEEKTYNAVLRDNHVVLLRFNPNAKYVNAPEYELVKMVWDKTLAPDFTSFRDQKHLL